MFDQPAQMHRLLDMLARSVTAYLNARIAACVQAVMVFDTWGGAGRRATIKNFPCATCRKSSRV